jgi:HlyD family secretion protein
VKKILIGAVVVVLLAVVVLASVRGGQGKKGVKVYAEDVVRRDLTEIVKASGDIEPRVKVELSAHVIGKIEKMMVKEGQWIEKGQPFLRLEREAYIAQRDQWAAQLRSAETSVKQAEVSLADSRNRLARAQKLSQEGIFTDQQLEDAQLQEKSAVLRLEEAGEAVEQARANLTKAQDDLSKTTIYAPLTGRVIELNAEEGEVVVSGTMNNPGSIIGVIADMSELLATVDVDETEIVNVGLGQDATLKVDALPGKEYHGKVVEVGSSGFSRAAQPDVTFFKVKILLSQVDDSLRARMSVRAEIKTDKHENALVVPIQAVVEREEKVGESDKIEPVKVVFAVADGKAKKIPVETGLSDETHVELVKGAAAGLEVITGPYRTLRDLKDGEHVKVSETSEQEDREKKKSDEESE